MSFITLHRQITEWEWYKDISTKVLFIHLLLEATHKDINYKGIELKRGQLVTSVRKLSKETGLSERHTRTALTHLKSTQEIAIKTTHKYSLITIEKYDFFQSKKEETTQQTTQQTTQYRHSEPQKSTQPYNNNIFHNNINNINNKTNKKHNNTSNDNNKNTITQKKNTKRKGYGIEAQIEKVNSEMLKEDLRDFVTMRKTIKDPLTERGMKILITKLIKMSGGDEQKAHRLLEDAIEHNWKSIYEREEKQQKPRNEVLEMLKDGAFDE